MPRFPVAQRILWCCILSLWVVTPAPHSVSQQVLGATLEEVVPDSLKIHPLSPLAPEAKQPAGLTVGLAQTTPLSTTFTLVGTYPPGGRPLTISGTIALLHQYNGLHLVDVANPAQPQLLSSFPLTSSSTAVMVGPHLVALGEHAIEDLPNAVYLVDVRNPMAPQQVGMIPLEQGVESLVNISSSAGLLYIATSRPQVLIVDVRNPATPQVVGRYRGVGEPFYVNGLAAVSDKLYLTGSYEDDSGTSLEVLNLVDPTNPQRIGRLAPEHRHFLRMQAIEGTTIYARGGIFPYLDFFAINAHNPTNIYTYSASVSFRINSSSVFATEGLVFVAGYMERDVNPGYQLIVFERTDSAHLEVSKYYQTLPLAEAPFSLMVADNYLYLSQNGLHIYRINYPYQLNFPIVNR
jgi:hypothetical protein